MAKYDIRPGVVGSVLRRTQASAKTMRSTGKKAVQEIQDGSQAVDGELAGALSGLNDHLTTMVDLICDDVDRAVHGTATATMIYDKADSVMAADARRALASAPVPEYFLDPAKFRGR